jgi:phage pi2 protein 07
MVDLFAASVAIGWSSRMALIASTWLLAKVRIRDRLVPDLEIKITTQTFHYPESFWNRNAYKYVINTSFINSICSQHFSILIFSQLL